MNKEDLLIDELLESYKETLSRDKRKEVELRRKVLINEIKESSPAKLLKRIEQEVTSEDASHINEADNDLLIFTGIDIDDLLVHWLENGECLIEGYLFRGAGPKAERLLFEILDSRFTDGHYFAIEYLAWCKSDRAVQQFVQWKKEPPGWSRNFQVPDSQFSICAGWEIDENNQKRMLYSEKCFALDIAFFETDPSNAVTCPLCQRPLLHLQLEKGILDDAIPEGAGFDTLRIPLCNICCRFDYGSMSVLRDGKLNLDLENLYKEDVPKWIKQSPILCGDLILKREAEPRDAYFAAAEWSKYKHTQLGGYPTWIQNPEHLICTTCRRSMFFILQFEEEETFNDSAEDTYYVFLCTFCKDRFYVTQQFT